MEAYLQVFINYEQNDRARLFPMTEFAYNNTKNISTSHTFFELNCGFHPRAFYKENVDPQSKLKVIDKLATKLRELTAVCRENFQHAKNFRSNIMISMQSLEAISQATKFG